MSKASKPRVGPNTQAIRAGQVRTQEQEHSEPIFASSSFVFESAAEAAGRFSGDAPGNIYSRFTNPTVRAFEQRLAAMEGAERCVATASGMSAILSVCMGLLKSGSHIVSSRSIFGTTVGLFSNVLPRFGVDTTFVPLTDLDAWSRAIQSNTRLLFLETPSNPLMEVADIAKLAQLARDRGCLLAVDNCLCTPALQRPLDLGADLVVHSATKYLDGQGRCVGGAVLGSEDLLGRDVFGFLRTAGPAMSPFNAWVFLKGLETLGVRMRAHCENALVLAHWLAEHPSVNRVYFPGLAEHPQHALAARQQTGFGAIVSFEVDGGRPAAWKIIDSVRLFSITANLGDTRSTVTHPTTTTHQRLSDAERAQAGITEGLLRLSVGLEDVDDLCGDLDQAFQVCAKSA